MVDFREDENLNTLNHSCAHLMAQAVKHLYPQAKFWGQNGWKPFEECKGRRELDCDTDGWSRYESRT